jgi:hypothetical protein
MADLVVAYLELICVGDYNGERPATPAGEREQFLRAPGHGFTVPELGELVMLGAPGQDLRALVHFLLEFLVQQAQRFLRLQ